MKINLKLNTAGENFMVYTPTSHYATNRQVAVSIPDGVILNFSVT